MLKKPRSEQKINDCVIWPFLVRLLFLLIDLTKKKKETKRAKLRQVVKNNSKKVHREIICKTFNKLARIS